jgi:hypothetical protein
MVRMVHGEFMAIEDDAKAGSVSGFHRGPEVMQQGLDLAPVEVAADRIVEDCQQDVAVLVAHDR